MKSWLFTILRNIWLNQLRHERTAPQLVELDAHEGIADVAIETSKDPYAQYVGKIEQEAVRNAILELPAEFREVIICASMKSFPTGKGPLQASGVAFSGRAIFPAKREPEGEGTFPGTIEKCRSRGNILRAWVF